MASRTRTASGPRSQVLSWYWVNGRSALQFQILRDMALHIPFWNLEGSCDFRPQHRQFPDWWAWIVRKGAIGFSYKPLQGQGGAMPLCGG